MTPTTANRDPITLAETDLLNVELRKPLADLLARSSPERIAALVLALRPAMGSPVSDERAARRSEIAAELMSRSSC